MRWIAWLALLVATLPAAAAQTRANADSLRVGAVELSLGMPQKTALGELSRQFHVEHARSAGEDWAVIERGKTVAIVSFSQNKLSRISKTWVSTDSRGAADLGGRLYSLAAEFTGQGRTECTLAAKPYKIAGVEGRIVTLACGSKSIQLIQSRIQGGALVTSLQEVIQ